MNEEDKYELWSKYARTMEAVGETVEVGYIDFANGIDLLEETE